MTKEEQLRGWLNAERDRNRLMAKESREADLTAKRRIRGLERQIAPLKEAAEAHAVRDEAIRAAVVRGTSVAKYSVTREPPRHGPGIPTLILSDLHVNETIDPRQVGGVNAFTPEIAKKRLETIFKTTVDLCLNHMVRPSRSGAVVPVLGDLLDVLGGFIHAGERQAIMVGTDAAAYVADLLQPGFEMIAEALGSVYSPWVTGNHGRITPKMSYQDRNAKNLDSTVFHILEGRLRGKKNIRLEIARGPRIMWTVFGHRFLALHGDPESGMPKGGDSESGAVNVVARGVKRLRSLHLQINQPFDTALMGHFHTGIELEGAMVNGCLPGFGEYASGRVFPFSVPFQTLFFTHPKYGITCKWRVIADKGEQYKSDSPAAIGTLT